MSGQTESSSASGGVGRSARVEVVHHLVEANDALSEFHRYRNYWTVCGQVLKTGELPSNMCEFGCECEVVYCPACLSEAARHNAGYPGA